MSCLIQRPLRSKLASIVPSLYQPVLLHALLVPRLHHYPYANARSSSVLSTPTRSWSWSRVAVISTCCIVAVTGSIYAYREWIGALPSEVRSDMRQGLLAERKGDRNKAIAYVSRAWETARSLPLSKFKSSDPILAVTGIFTHLAGLYEDRGQLDVAYHIYREGFLFMVHWTHEGKIPTGQETKTLMQDLSSHSSKAVVRMAGIALKLGQLAQDLNKSLDEQEEWLVWAAEAIIRRLKPSEGLDLKRVGLAGEEEALATPLEQLGSFYERTGRDDRALMLYLHASSILIPPGSSNIRAQSDNRCRGAELMGRIASIFLRQDDRDTPDPQVLHQAEAWLKKGIDIVHSTSGHSYEKPSVAVSPCDFAHAMLLLQMADMKLKVDMEEAKKLAEEARLRIRRLEELYSKP